MAAEVTRTLVLHLSLIQASSAPARSSAAAPADPRDSSKAQQVFTKGNNYLAQGAYAEAVGSCEEAVGLNPRHADAIHNFGAALCRSGHYQDAEGHFRDTIRLRPNCSEAHGNPGTVLRL